MHISLGGANPNCRYKPCASAVCSIHRKPAPGPRSIIALTSSFPNPLPRASWVGLPLRVTAPSPQRVPRLRGTVVGMGTAHVIDRISRLLDSDMTQTSNTSMRIPTGLRDAATLAARELGAAPSATALTTAALRAALEAVVMQAVLDDHYERYPDSRPDLGDLAITAAELDGNPLAAQPDLIRQAAAELSARRLNPDPEDVLLWAEARMLPPA